MSLGRGDLGGRWHRGVPADAALRQAERLARNDSALDPAQSRRVALQLHDATRRTAAYFGSDLRLAYRLASTLLRHESAQRGFRLAATQDVHFTEVGGGHARGGRREDGHQGDGHRHGGCRMDTRVMGTIMGGVGVGG